jgi:hypothetical protein
MESRARTGIAGLVCTALVDRASSGTSIVARLREYWATLLPMAVDGHSLILGVGRGDETPRDPVR